MDSNEYYRLKERISIANQKKAVYDAHIAQYVEEAEFRLFEAFCNTPAGDIKNLQLIRMQHGVLRGLKANFIDGINDGVIAQSILEQSGD